MTSHRFDRIETEAEFHEAQKELLRLAYEERLTPLDAERASLTELLNDFKRRQVAR